MKVKPDSTDFSLRTRQTAAAKHRKSVASFVRILPPVSVAPIKRESLPDPFSDTRNEAPRLQPKGTEAPRRSSREGCPRKCRPQGTLYRHTRQQGLSTAVALPHAKYACSGCPLRTESWYRKWANSDHRRPSPQAWRKAPPP